MKRIATVVQTAKWFKAKYIDGGIEKVSRDAFSDIKAFEASIRNHGVIVVPQALFEKKLEQNG